MQKAEWKTRADRNGGGFRGWGGSVIGQDKVNTVSHSVPREFPWSSLGSSHSACVTHTVSRTADRPAPSDQPIQALERDTEAPIRHLKLQLLWLLVGAILITLLALTTGSFGFVITLTDSSCPIGIYRLVRKPIERGQLVEACLPNTIASYGIAREYLASGRCPNGAEPVIKIVGATRGDRVDLSSEGIRVNGVALPQSATLSRDSRGRDVQTLRRGTYQTPNNLVWLFGLHDARSWDSRYFGPVPVECILGALVPAFTTESH